MLFDLFCSLVDPSENTISDISRNYSAIKRHNHRVQVREDEEIRQDVIEKRERRQLEMLKNKYESK